jgi:micrococcal nuclease
MSKKQLKQLAAIAGILLILLMQRFDIVTPEAVAEGYQTSGVTTSTNALVERVVDGDTIEVKLDSQVATAKVRLLGVNTPESVDPRKGVECFGKEASGFAAATLEGKRVKLIEDPQADNVDKYQRLLRIVILEDETDFNLLLVQRGYANAYLDFPLDKQRKAELSQAESEARDSGLGLWSTSTCSGTK